MMPKKAPYKAHLSCSNDLITTSKETRDGFLELVFVKSNRAIPYVTQARKLKQLASKCKRPSNLIHLDDIRTKLLAAGGVSEKAAKALDAGQQKAIAAEFVKQYLEPAGKHFVDELVYRFLLIKGDSMGGSMRNFIGERAQGIFKKALVDAILKRNSHYSLLGKKGNRLYELDQSIAPADTSVKGITWNAVTKKRTLLFNLKVPVVGKSVDAALLNADLAAFSTDVMNNPTVYLALGELKGGIDPAGSDEHWKTASEALNRIRSSFSSHGVHPQIFFIGASVVQGIAEKIWDHLAKGVLANAANLNRERQLSSLCGWLIEI